MENISSKTENEVHSMRDVYEYCPEFENDKYLLRLISEEDTNDLLKVYSDASAVPFFLMEIIVMEMISITKL